MIDFSTHPQIVVLADALDRGQNPPNQPRSAKHNREKHDQRPVCVLLTIFLHKYLRIAQILGHIRPDLVPTAILFSYTKQVQAFTVEKAEHAD
jgi:hypothetical protein